MAEPALREDLVCFADAELRTGWTAWKANEVVCKLDPPHKVGEFVVDYSELTADEIAAPLDPDVEELFKSAKTISVKREL